MGQPRDAFGGITVAKGTPEETAYRASRKGDADRVQREALDRIAREDAVRRAREKEAEDALADAERAFRTSVATANDNARDLIIAAAAALVETGPA
jgi:hypothetical protein